MTTEDALLAAVLAAPDDDLPRLVLADHYEGELGQPERAEFIRLQCRIDDIRRGCWCGSCRKSGQHHNGPCAIDRERVELPDGGSRQAFLRREERAFLGLYAESWGCGWPDISMLPSNDTRPAVKFRRGFVSEVRCTLAEWCGGECPDCDETNTACPTCCRPGTDSEPTNFVPGDGPQIVRRHPVMTVVLTGVVVPSAVQGTPFGAVTRESAGPLFDVAFKKAITSRVEGHAEELGKIISDAAIEWAKSQNNPKAAFALTTMWG